MWKTIGANGEVERLACWDLVLADPELATLIADGNQPKGRVMLQVLKAIRALDSSGDGNIHNKEFRRLYLPQNLLAAEAAVSAGLEPEYLSAL